MHRRRSLLVGASLVTLVPGLVRAQEKTTLVLGTATPGGGFPVYGAAFAETVNEVDPTLSVQPRNTRGQHREHSADRGRPARHRAGHRRAALRSDQRDRARAGQADPDHCDVLDPGHVRRPRRQPASQHRRPGRQAGRVRRKGLGPGDPRALCARRPRLRHGEGLPGGLSGSRRRRPDDGAGRPRRRAVGRRQRLAGLHRDGRERGRRALHRAPMRSRPRASSPSTRC